MVNKERKNKNLASLILAIPVFMFILAYLSVPLYDLFCKVTGYGGTTQDTEHPSEIILDNKIKIRFNADRERDLGVYFQPVKRSIVTNLGKTNTVEYKISNNTNNSVAHKKLVFTLIN